jgi:G patch domain-containing protein 1
VFDFMSKKDRERLVNIKSNLTTGQPQPQAESMEYATTTGSHTFTMPRTEPHVAQAALRGFKPFVAEPAKQARYEGYLESQLDPGGDGPGPELKALAGQKPDEFKKEMEDYAKAALLFKPMSGAMAGRFQSAGVIDMNKPKEGIESGTDDDQNQDAAPQQPQRTEDPKANAAKMGMYGPLTREVRLWIPARLLCKRFGVKDPDVSASTHLDPTSSSSQPSKDQQGQAEFEAAAGPPSTGGSSNPQDQIAGSSTAPDTKRNGPRDLANIGLGEDDDQGRDTLTYERPSMDVFKAIFASDDEEEEGEEDVKEEKEETIAHIFEPTTSVQAPPAQNEPVDLTTFKPTFIPRAGKEKEKDDAQLAKKAKKKKEKNKGVLSFEMDEDGGGLAVKPERPKKKKRRGKEEKGESDKANGKGQEEEDMWVEKPVAEAVKTLSIAPLPEDSDKMDVETTNGPRGRKRAIDFL